MWESLQASTMAFMQTYPTEIVLSTLSLTAIVSIVWGVREIIRAKDNQYLALYVPRIRTKVLTSAREKYVDGLIAEGVKYAIEKLVHGQAITRYEANTRYRRLNKGFRHKDFIPGTFLLKAAMQARQKARSLHPATTTKTVTDNGTVVKSNVVRPAFGDKSLRRQKPKSA
jgi:hypothetical protein